MPRLTLKHLPNAITLTRIALIPVLVALVLLRRETPFTVILIGSLLGDIVDGLLARALGACSELGAMLDSLADTLLLFVAAWGAWVFHRTELAAHLGAFAAVPAFWALENLAALLRYRRLSSFHTYLSRAAAYAMGIFVGVLFCFGFSLGLMRLALGVFILATCEEFVLLWLLPVWTADVRGLWWVLRPHALQPGP